MDSLGTAEAVVTVSKRVDPRAAAGFGMSWNRSADGTRWAMMSGFPHGGRLFADTKLSGGTTAGGPGRSAAWMAIKSHVMPGVVSTTTNAKRWWDTPRSDVRPCDDILADRYDAIYRDGCPSRVREVA
jgi:hypothetical protein